MKKILLLAMLLTSGIGLSAQTFFSEDFSGGIPGGWSNVDNSGNNVLWRTTTTGSMNTNVSVDTILNPAGTSAANGYLIIDSDSAGQLLTQDAVLTTTAINCTGHSSVHLAFNEYFAQYLASTGTVSVSNDNVTWNDVHQAHTGLGLNQGTPNANYVNVDITSIAANQATVYIRISYHGEWDYWWFVDDLALIEPPAIDVAAVSIEKLNTEYTLIPYFQATTLDMSAEVSNVGANATAGGSALFEIINSSTVQTVFSENISLAPMNPGAMQTVVPSGTFAPTGPGAYKSRITVSVGGDANASNDVMESAQILLSDSVYSRDDGIFAATLGVGVGPGEDAAMGQNFRVNNADNLTSISFFLDAGFGAQPNGTPVYFTVHPQANDSINPDGFTTIATSETLLVTPGMIPFGGSWYTVGLQGGPVALNPGLYFLALHEVDSILTIGYSNSIYSPGAVWVHWNSIPQPPAINGWAHAEDFTVEIAYMIRANFAGNWDGISEAGSIPEFSVYPNPSSGIFYLAMKDNAPTDGVTYKILNVLGQCVYENVMRGNEVQIVKLDNVNEGLYIVQMNRGSAELKKKILVVR